MPKKPVQFSIPDREVDELAGLADRLGISRSEVVRQSLEVYRVLRDAADKGAQVFIELDGQRERLARI